MKIDRLIGILTVLLQREKVTAPMLAEKFEVSRRTINRDIEVLCNAGIPICTTQGQNGGISIMDGYKIDKNIFTTEEMHAILAGLKSLDSASSDNRYKLLMEKITNGNNEILQSNNHIVIDLSSWYKESLAPKIKLIQKAIDENTRIAFHYYSPSGENDRLIEPYLLLFRWSSWYVWGYCTSREAFRLFKLNRLDELQDTGEKYEQREVPNYTLNLSQGFSDSPFHTILEVEPSVKWKIIEEYGVGSYKEQSDGTLRMDISWDDKDYMFSWLLGLGEHVRIVEPEDLRNEYCNMIQKILNYNQT